MIEDKWGNLIHFYAYFDKRIRPKNSADRTTSVKALSGSRRVKKHGQVVRLKREVRGVVIDMSS